MNPQDARTPGWIAQYQALTGAAAVVDFAERTQVELTGADRARFLNNLCTNDIRQLAMGAGREAFLTSVQGKTLAHVFVFACPDSLLIDTVGGQGEAIVAHLDHYLVSEKVTLADRSAQWAEMLVAGPKAQAVLSPFADDVVPNELLSHAGAKIAGKACWLRRVEMTPGGGYLVSMRREDAPAIHAALVEAGALDCGDEAFEAARIEHGFPSFGRDITDKNLPQEVARDTSAISFVKGCYLGQETVARIDALGHVNKMLAGLRFAGSAVPARGTELSAGEQIVGQVTSATFSPRLGVPLALGYVRSASHAPGTRLASSAGEAEVVALPVG